MFSVNEEIAPTKKTSGNRVKDEPALPTYLPAALSLVNDKPMAIGKFLESLRSQTGLTHSRSKAFRNWATAGTAPALKECESRGRGRHEVLIGLPDHISQI
jgi:hypothetical protein